MKRHQANNFDWDSGNLDKSYQKHNITPNQAEEAFLDEKLFVLPDFKHSQKEKRLIAIGMNFNKQLLFIIFTIRSLRVRIISARPANKKERSLYEKT